MHAYAMCKNGNLFVMKKYNPENTFRGGIVDISKPNVSKKLVKDLIMDQVRDNPSVSPVTIMADFKRDYGVDLSYNYAYHGREKAMKELFGDEEKSYADLEWYIEELKKTNPEQFNSEEGKMSM